MIPPRHGGGKQFRILVEQRVQPLPKSLRLPDDALIFGPGNRHTNTLGTMGQYGQILLGATGALAFSSRLGHLELLGQTFPRITTNAHDCQVA